MVWFEESEAYTSPSEQTHLSDFLHPRCRRLARPLTGKNLRPLTRGNARSWLPRILVGNHRRRGPKRLRGLLRASESNPRNLSEMSKSAPKEAILTEHETEEDRLTTQEAAYDYLRERVIVDPRTGCWKWQLSKNQGYGQMRWGQTFWRVHRFSYHYLVAYLHKSTLVHHKCGQRSCCNPEHLQEATHHDNVAEMLGRVYYEEELEHLRDEVQTLTVRVIELEGERSDGNR